MYGGYLIGYLQIVGGDYLTLIHIQFHPRHLRSIRLPPQNSALARKLGGSRTAHKIRLVRANNRFWMPAPY